MDAEHSKIRTTILPESSGKMQIGIGNAFFGNYGNNIENLKKYAMIFNRIDILYVNALTDQFHELKYLQDREFLHNAKLTEEGHSIFVMAEEELDTFEFIRKNNDLKHTILEITKFFSENQAVTRG